MNTLERAGQSLASHPARGPSPIAAIEKRARALRRRRAIGAALVTTTLVLVLAAGGVAVTRDTRTMHISTPAPDVPTSSPPITPTRDPFGPAAGTKFTPPAQSHGDQTQLPVTLANGDTLTLEYPSELNLADLGFRPATGIGWGSPGDACCSRTLEIRHGTIGDVFPGRTPQKSYPGSDGQSVLYFTDPSMNYLAFQIGDWVVAVPDYDATSAAANNTPMTDDERATYATNLTGHQTADGYLVLTPRTPLTPIFTDSPSATFGDDSLDILYRGCAPHTQPLPASHGFSLEARDDTGTWLCYNRIPIVVHVAGSQPFQDQVTRDLQIVANHQSAYG